MSLFARKSIDELRANPPPDAVIAPPTHTVPRRYQRLHP